MKRQTHIWVKSIQEAESVNFVLYPLSSTFSYQDNHHLNHVLIIPFLCFLCHTASTNISSKF